MERKTDTAIEEFDSGHPKFEVDASVPAKYHGTAADARDMAVLGKKQVLRVCLLRDKSRASGADNDSRTAELQVRDDAGLCQYRHGILGGTSGPVQDDLGRWRHAKSLLG